MTPIEFARQKVDEECAAFARYLDLTRKYADALAEWNDHIAAYCRDYIDRNERGDAPRRFGGPDTDAHHARLDALGRERQLASDALAASVRARETAFDSLSWPRPA